ncbi:MAG: DUF4062 domain-containing protein [Psychrobacter sp.]
MFVPNYRYHIHVICADNDQLLVLDNLAIFFQTSAFLTYDVSSQLPKASLYGRRCIDSCNYALMVIGDSYGTVQRTGVSQMHLSYLNAKAKTKPLVILIKNHCPNSNISRELKEFIGFVTKQDNQIYYYDTANDIEKLLGQAHHNTVANREVIRGWVKASSQESELSNKTVDQKLINVDFKHNSRSNTHVKIGKASKPIALMQKFNIHYSAQAYEGGNLTDVTRSMSLVWQEVLVALSEFSTPFSSYGLQSAINRLIASKAEKDNELPTTLEVGVS